MGTVQVRDIFEVCTHAGAIVASPRGVAYSTATASTTYKSRRVCICYTIEDWDVRVKVPLETLPGPRTRTLFKP